MAWEAGHTIKAKYIRSIFLHHSDHVQGSVICKVGPKDADIPMGSRCNGWPTLPMFAAGSPPVRTTTIRATIVIRTRLFCRPVVWTGT